MSKKSSLPTLFKPNGMKNPLSSLLPYIRQNIQNLNGVNISTLSNKSKSTPTNEDAPPTLTFTSLDLDTSTLVLQKYLYYESKAP